MLVQSDVDRNDAVGERDGSIRVRASQEPRGSPGSREGPGMASIDLATSIIQTDN